MAVHYFFGYSCEKCRQGYATVKKMGFWDWYRYERPECPRCHKKMEEVRMERASDVMIERWCG
jgi:predicted SprT family Zn-dependent metalloprotease